MLVDASLPPTHLQAIPAIAAAAEALGFSGIWSNETMHDPFLPGALIAENSRQIQFGTAVAIAFARSPATLAYTAWDLAEASSGRFILGLGTQVKAHIERRFGMPWPESVVGKLRDQIGAIRALWNTWQTGVPLRFQSEYYRLSLMSPFFNPGPIQYPAIPIYIAGVNPGLAQLAGEAADGFVVHPFHSLRYLEEILRPAIQHGAEKAGRSPDQIKIAANVFVVTSPQEADLVRAQISFYASTPSYRNVMKVHGWEETAEQLSSLAAHGRWGEMPDLIDETMLKTFAVLAEPAEVPSALADRYTGLADRLGLYLPFIPGERDKFWTALIGRLAIE